MQPPAGSKPRNSQRSRSPKARSESRLYHFDGAVLPDFANLLNQIDGAQVWATDAGYALYEIAVDVGPKCLSRTAEVTPACATAVLMSGKVWPIWGTDPRGRKTTYGEFAGQKVHYVM